MATAYASHRYDDDMCCARRVVWPADKPPPQKHMHGAECASGGCLTLERLGWPRRAVPEANSYSAVQALSSWRVDRTAQHIAGVPLLSPGLLLGCDALSQLGASHTCTIASVQPRGYIGQ